MEALFWNDLTLKVSFEALNDPLFDRLDIYSDAIDLKNTLVVFVLALRLFHPSVQTSTRKNLSSTGYIQRLTSSFKSLAM